MHTIRKESASSNQSWIEYFFQAIDSGNWDSLSLFLADEVIYERPGYSPLVGKKMVLDFYKNVRIIKTGTHIVKGFTYSDDMLSYHGSFTGESYNGDKLSVDYCDFCNIKNGLLHHRKTFFHVASV
ncbi:MAG: nuclear transport factor 2 family protein [Endozoicomonas sp.]|uniref:nuclear transport factor 2 family protein n=1 Tax=Endozoicomonas sp. TaxID=1892382 RepID=UPI003D9BC73C